MCKLEPHPFSELICNNGAVGESLSPREIRKACIEELREHYKWYQCASRRQKILWFGATIVSAVLGAAVTVAVGLGWAGTAEGRVAVTIVSAIATGLTSLLATFATRDAWQLREDGRIAINELMARACRISEDDPRKALNEAVEFLNQAHEVERTQAKGYFGFLTPRPNNPPARRKDPRAGPDQTPPSVP